MVIKNKYRSAITLSYLTSTRIPTKHVLMPKKIIFPWILSTSGDPTFCEIILRNYCHDRESVEMQRDSQ